MFDRATRQARLRGGDVGSDRVHVVPGGRVDGLILGRAEAARLLNHGDRVRVREARR